MSSTRWHCKPELSPVTDTGFFPSFSRKRTESFSTTRNLKQNKVLYGCAELKEIEMSEFLFAGLPTHK